MDIILASTSPRRIEMMRWLGVPFTIVPSLFDEKTIRDNRPDMLTQKLSIEKARSVKDRYPGSIIVGCDSVVAFEGNILEKAENEAEQRRLIYMQKGKDAEVYTSIAVINTATNQEVLKTVISPYKMAKVSDTNVEEYIKSGKGKDKAGGYGLQDLDGIFLESINGCYSGALGFPLCEVVEILKTMGVKIDVDIKKVVKEKTGKDC